MGHENLNRDDDVKMGSEKSFGFVFSAVFSIIALWPLISGGGIRVWAILAAALFLGLALVAPKMLRPLNRVWFAFGLVLHKVVNPVVMALLFFTTVTPTALIMRAFGKDPLTRKFDPQAKTYWIERDPPGPAPDSMHRQF